jgi:hypothetical protein
VTQKFRVTTYSKIVQMQRIKIKNRLVLLGLVTGLRKVFALDTPYIARHQNYVCFAVIPDIWQLLFNGRVLRSRQFTISVMYVVCVGREEVR